MIKSQSIYKENEYNIM